MNNSDRLNIISDVVYELIIVPPDEIIPVQILDVVSRQFNAVISALQTRGYKVVPSHDPLYSTRENAARYVWLRDVHIGDDPEAINLAPAKKRGLDAAIDAQRKGS